MLTPGIHCPVLDPSIQPLSLPSAVYSGQVQSTKTKRPVPQALQTQPLYRCCDISGIRWPPMACIPRCIESTAALHTPPHTSPPAMLGRPLPSWVAKPVHLLPLLRLHPTHYKGRIGWPSPVAASGPSEANLTHITVLSPRRSLQYHPLAAVDAVAVD